MTMKSQRGYSGFVLSGLCVIVSLELAATTEIGKATDSPCREVAYAYKAKGLRDEVPNTTISGESLQFCSTSMTCCTPQMEKYLADQTRTAFSEALNKEVAKVKQKMASRTTKFDEFFQSLIRKSQEDFHDMFHRTYGIQYEQNTELFKQMFNNLEVYYTQGGINLADKMRDFFVELYQKMFLVLNSQYSINDQYLTCVGGTMAEVQPFKDVPEKLINEVTRSFVATRVFVQALGVGRDVMTALHEHLEPSSTCIKAMSKMNVCPQCNGFPEVKPCPTYCQTVIGECLQDLGKVDQFWTKFIDTMINLASRMEKSFNIESVVEPIDLKISDAIMNFQESHEDAIKLIYKKCGNPKFRTSKAAAQSQPPSTILRQRRSPIGNNWGMEGPLRYSKRTQNNDPSANRGAARATRPQEKKRKDNNGLEKHMEAIKKHLKNMRAFFSQLPNRICEKDNSNPNSSDGECWNGSEKTRNGNSTGVDVKIVKTRPNKQQRSIIARQIDMLKLITKKLELAYVGKTVEWTADEDHGSQSTLRSDAGSGDFEGSGAYPASGDDHQVDPDAEGGDDDEEIRPSHTPPSTPSEPPTTGEDLYFSSSTTEAPSSSKAPSGKPGGKRKRPRKNGARKAASEANSAPSLGTTTWLLGAIFAVLLSWWLM